MNPNILNAQELNILALRRTAIQVDSDSDFGPDFGSEDSSSTPDNNQSRALMMPILLRL